jgi:hypothetical protein
LWHISAALFIPILTLATIIFAVTRNRFARYAIPQYTASAYRNLADIVFICTILLSFYTIVGQAAIVLRMIFITANIFAFTIDTFIIGIGNITGFSVCAAMFDTIRFAAIFKNMCILPTVER